MDGFEYKQQDLASYPLFDWQPVELLEKGGCMIIFGSSVNELQPSFEGVEVWWHHWGLFQEEEHCRSQGETRRENV